MVDCRIDVLAVSPFETVRHARISFEAPRRAMCRALSRPRPVFAPVTMIVWPDRLAVGVGRDTVTLWEVHCVSKWKG